MLLSLASLAAPYVMSPTRSLLQTISADTLARRDLVPICVIRDSLLFLNGRCAALLGRSGEEFPKGLPLREVVAEADWPRVARSLRPTTLKPGSSRIAHFQRRAQGWFDPGPGADGNGRRGRRRNWGGRGCQ